MLPASVAGVAVSHDTVHGAAPVDNGNLPGVSVIPTLAIVGATGTGKSELALDVAEASRAAGRDVEIINADAMQLYRGMNIGTAKVMGHARRGIPHHLFDVLEPSEEASVAAYQRDARQAIDRVASLGHLPIVVGGSGLYVWSVVFDFRFPPRDASLRAKLSADLDAHGLGSLLARLREFDPIAATEVDTRNPRRVLRALEIATLTAAQGASSDQGAPVAQGVPLAHGAAVSQDVPVAQVHLPERLVPVRPLVVVGLDTPRSVLVERLDTRVERMWAEGMIHEVEKLREAGLEQGVTASRAIGYAQALAQLRGELSEAEAIADTQRLTRRYARRQRSWFTRNPDVHWLPTETTTAPERTAQTLSFLEVDSQLVSDQSSADDLDVPAFETEEEATAFATSLVSRALNPVPISHAETAPRGSVFI